MNPINNTSTFGIAHSTSATSSANSARRGFTLIELLVVIAIIAILASILFPVFAQAKAAAKKADSISNNKQLSLAAIMYTNDNDDAFMLTSYNLSFNANPASPDSTPLLMEYPYIKAIGVMMDPMDPASVSQRQYPDAYAINPSSVAWSSAQAQLNFTATADWGINDQYFDPVFLTPDGTFQMTAITQTSIVRPADTYMALSSVYSRTPSGTPYGGGWEAVDPPCILDTNNNDTRPFTSNGYESLWYGGWNLDQPLAPDEFGGVWPWYNSGQSVVVSYADGHARSVNLMSLTAGCNALDGWNGQITDKTKDNWATTF